MKKTMPRSIGVFVLFVTGLLMVQSVGGSTPSQADDLELRVRDFVHQRYVHGVPYGGARELGPEAVPILEAMLDDPTEEEFLPTIVMTIGFIGEESSLAALVDFLENRHHGEVSIHQFRALLAVNSAMGHIAGRGSALAFDYLARGCRSATWREKELAWSYQHWSGEGLAILLSKISVNGLSFTGTERAEEILLDLRENPESPASAAALLPNIDEGLVRIQRIRESGPEEVFGGSR
jgi:hypothetical protein